MQTAVAATLLEFGHIDLLAGDHFGAYSTQSNVDGMMKPDFGRSLIMLMYRLCSCNETSVVYAYLSRRVVVLWCFSYQYVPTPCET